MGEPNELLEAAKFSLQCFDDGLTEPGLRKLRAAVEKADAAQREDDDKQMELLALRTAAYGG